MALSFALSLSFAVLLSAVLPVQSSYCASTCAVHVTQPILFFVANAPNHIPGLSRKGPFKCYVTLFFWKLDPHPPPRNANNIEHYTFVTLFSRKSDTPHPHLRYVTLEWPLSLWWTHIGQHLCRPPIFTFYL